MSIGPAGVLARVAVVEERVRMSAQEDTIGP